jgi:fructokinase
MLEKKYGLIGLGSAIVDIISYKKQGFLDKYELTKGSMKLIDANLADKIYGELGAATECSGGSSANTVAVFGLLGGVAGFIGKTKDDLLGKVFKSEIEKANVELLTTPSHAGFSTSKCLILVTEEELEGGRMRIERTMATYLDFDVLISENDINEEIIKQAEILFFEGYLFDNANAKKAVLKALNIAKQNNTKIAFTLSDPFCVDRHRSEFLEVINSYADIVFTNEKEAISLYKASDLKEILHKFLNLKAICCITKGENGSYIANNGKLYDIDAVKIDEVYDVTGAGDAYAGGFLFALSKNYPLEKCGEIASKCATEVIKFIGGRPQTDLKKLLPK